MPAKAVDEGPSAWAPTTYIGDGDSRDGVTGSCCQPGPAMDPAYGLPHSSEGSKLGRLASRTGASPRSLWLSSLGAGTHTMGTDASKGTGSLLWMGLCRSPCQENLWLTVASMKEAQTKGGTGRAESDSSGQSDTLAASAPNCSSVERLMFAESPWLRCSCCISPPGQDRSIPSTTCWAKLLLPG